MHRPTDYVILFHALEYHLAANMRTNTLSTSFTYSPNRYLLNYTSDTLETSESMLKLN